MFTATDPDADPAASHTDMTSADAVHLVDSGAPDPTLTQLIPQPTRWRWVALPVAVAVIFIGAWFSPMVFRPSVQPQQGGMLGPVSKSHQLVTVTSIKVDGWPKPRIEAVRDVPGASVDGAWLVEDDGQNLGDGPASDAQKNLLEKLTGSELVNAAEPSAIFGEAAQLPQGVSSDTTFNLVVIWNVNDCAALDPDNPITVDISTSVTRAVGATRSSSLAGPGSSELTPGYDVDLLRETGVCP